MQTHIFLSSSMNTGSTTGIGSSIISSTSDIGSHTSNDSGHGISSSTNNILAVALAASENHFLPLRSKGRKSILEKSVLQRNCYIENVLLLEGDSIVLLAGCLESSGW